MQTVRVAIDVNPRDIPNLVCAQSADIKENPGYSSAISEALANALGVQEFLHQPERIDELRRVLWEKDQRADVSIRVLD
jgi:hypothetical protein